MGNGDELVTVAVFNTEPEAELARSRLAGVGIDSMIQRDDAGGMYPQFQQVRGLRLKVRKEDEIQAKELLAPLEGAQVTEPEAEDDPRRESPEE
jgi:hypothetical protein